MWVMVMMDHNILIALVSSLLMLILGPLIIDVISVSKKFARLLSTALKFLRQNSTVLVDSVNLDDNPPPPAGSIDSEGLTYGDVEIVTARLGLARWRCGEITMRCQGHDAISVVDELMDGKKASEGELEEAFYVFDRDEDGFICAWELWNVMRRLGLKEGVKYEDCMMMIHSFDQDGDGKISFLEFRRMMENAI